MPEMSSALFCIPWLRPSLCSTTASGWMPTELPKENSSQKHGRLCSKKIEDKQKRFLAMFGYGPVSSTMPAVAHLHLNGLLCKDDSEMRVCGGLASPLQNALLTVTAAGWE